MISWITDNIAIGEYTDVINEELLKKEKIDCILSLRTGLGLEESMNESYLDFLEGLGIIYYNVPVGINPHKDINTIKIELRTAAYMLEQLTNKYKRILVHCTAGMDRAPFVVAYWMLKHEPCPTLLKKGDDIFSMHKRDLRFWIIRAYEFIKEKRPQIIEHMEWI